MANYDFDYLEDMFFRLSEAKSFRKKAKSTEGKSLAECWVCAIQMSIKDYLDTHGAQTHD